MAILCLLNGQYFANAVVALSLVMLSLAIWLGLLRNQRLWRVALLVILIHVVIVGGAIWRLPELLARQRSFNATIEKMARP
ncbi:MAG: hypothetical protein IT427_15030 [Pirellulales bacterium]|nr:hypothetical protein [Pirellulales bacterium]